MMKYKKRKPALVRIHYIKFEWSVNCILTKEKGRSKDRPFVLALPIFPARLQASIVGRNELKFRVRNGNGWTLILINTNYSITYTLKTEQ